MRYESYKSCVGMLTAAGDAERGAPAARNAREHGGGAERQDPRRISETTMGLTLIEILIALAVFAVLALGVGTLMTRFTGTPRTLLSFVDNEQIARRSAETMLDELRTMAPGVTGSYLIESADAHAITFYANVDRDPAIERVRFIHDGTTITRRVTDPTGNPPTYGSTNEQIATIADNVRNGASPVFTYYDTSYTGSEPPLTLPAARTAIRHIGITVTIDTDPTAPPQPFTVRTGVTPRVLKDNL